MTQGGYIPPDFIMVNIMRGGIIMSKYIPVPMFYDDVPIDISFAFFLKSLVILGKIRF